MALFGSLFKGNSNNINLANTKAREQANAAYRNNLQYAGEGRDRRRAEYQPFQQRYGQAGSLYSNALGLGGAEARQSAYDTFANDPFREAARGNTQNQLSAMFKKYNAGGMGDSGASRLALSRANMEAEAGLVDNWLNRLAAMDQQGLGVADRLSGIEGDYTGQQIGIEDQFRGTEAKLAQQYAQAQNANKLAQMNTTMGAIGMGLNALGSFGGVPSFGKVGQGVNNLAQGYPYSYQSYGSWGV